MNKLFNEQYSLSNVIDFGGWFFCESPANLVDGIEGTVVNSVSHASEVRLETYHDLLNNIKSKEYQRYSEIFDLVSMDPYLGFAQYQISNELLKTEFTYPLLWTYPNFRIDVPERGDFSAPPHCDEWISFRGKKSLVFWMPLFEDGYLDVSTYRGKLDVKKHDYWGVSTNLKSGYDWKTILVPRGKVLIFRSDLLHKSSEKWHESKLRMSVQFRFEDYANVPKPFVRAVTQKLAPSIIEQQDKILKIGYSNSNENI